MPSKTLSKDLYADHSPTRIQRVALTAGLGLSVGAAWWLLFGGVTTVFQWFGRHWSPGDPARRLYLAVALSIYFIRVLFTQFVFLKRSIRWSEAAIIVVWVFILCLWLTLAADTNSARPGVATMSGISLFLVGSWMNTWSEHARNVWKNRPENRGRLYTHGFFRFTRHPNYLGDLISFSGLCLITGRWITAPIPVLMLSGFVFINVPLLDAHLHDHYGTAFDEYARRTRKLIPFLY